MQKLNPAGDEDWQILPTKLPDLRLTGEAYKEYQRIGYYLLQIDRVTELDRQSLVHYCVQWAHFVTVYRELKDQDLAQDGPTNIVAHPLLRPLLKSAAAVVRVACDYGLTARTRDLESSHGNRKSRALKKLEGNLRKVGTHHLESPTEMCLPDWKPADVAPPVWVSDRARDEYNRLKDTLVLADMFCPLDQVPVTITCCMFDLYCRAYEELDSLMIPVFNAKGVEVKEIEHPLHKVMTDIADTLTYLWKDYGQTPRFRKVFSGEEKKKTTYDAPIIFKPRTA